MFLVKTIYKVECAKGCSYTQEIENDRDKPSYHRPYKCGACGSYAIRVWELVMDSFHTRTKEADNG